MNQTEGTKLRKKVNNDLRFEILSELNVDPQKPFSHIASKLKISQNTVKKFYEKMIHDKIILHSSIIIDLSKIGFQGKARFNIITDKKEETIESLQRMPQVYLISETSGDFDIIALVAVKDYTEIMDTCKTIQEMPTIKSVDVCLTRDVLFPADIKFNKML